MDSINNAAVIIDTAIKLGKAETQTPTREKVGNLEVLLARDGTVKSLEAFADNPRRKRAEVALTDCASFVAYLNAHKIPGHTIVFGNASETGGAFHAIIDYHGASEARWGEHTASLRLDATPEWSRWLANNGKLIPQEQFAEFIEDNLMDITTPDAATILETVQGLQGRKAVSFKSGKNLKDGAIQFEYVESIEVQGTTSRRDDSFRVPDKLVLYVRPFVGASFVALEARLRFRIGSDGKLFFAYILNRPHKHVEDAFLTARNAITTGTELVVHSGSGKIVRAQ